MLHGDEFWDEVSEIANDIQADIRELVQARLKGTTPAFQAAVKERLSEQVRFW